jgi:putative nucleotidyltransferase with HDIG domain
VSPAVAATVHASPAVREAARALGDSGDAWVVGGAIRDALLGREVVDADLAVAGDEAEAARTLGAAAGGHAFELSAEFGTWRVVAQKAGWHVDVSRLRAETIEGDLSRRDFTVNAMALPLSDPAAEPIDPVGGMADAESRLLRAASPASFEDDPLRVLRAARLAAALELELDPATVTLARESVAALAGVTGERQSAELRMLMISGDPLRGLRLLDELAATGAVLPEVEALRGVEQNPNHHLDVLGHTLEVLERWLEIEADLPAYVGDHADEVAALLAEPLADELTRAQAMRLGALFHDVGKPATRDEAHGYVTFIGHDSEGAAIVTRLCKRLRTSGALRDYVRGLTLHHLRLGFLSTQRPLTPRAVYEYLRATEPVAVDVSLLSVADRLAARGAGPIASSEMVEAHLATARDIIGAALDWRRDGPPPPLVRGDELATVLGIEPGPEIGRLLGEIEAAQYAGEITTRDETIELARQLAADSQ